jgi:hypothetical protein
MFGKFLIAFLFSMNTASAVQAAQLLCASKKNESLYYGSGQILLLANIHSENELGNLEMTFTGDSVLGAKETIVTGTSKGKYTKFNLYGDPLCSYKLTLFQGFAAEKATTAFLDAYCDDGSTNEIKLSCSIK